MLSCHIHPCVKYWVLRYNTDSCETLESEEACQSPLPVDLERIECDLHLLWYQSMQVPLVSEL